LKQNKMLVRMNPYFLLFAAAVATVFAGAMWYAFVRPLPQLSATGVITNKTFVAARNIQRFQGGPRSETWSQETFKIPEGYLFDIRVEGLLTTLQYSLPALGAEKYNVGQKVSVRYAERGIAPFWKQILVTEMTPVDPSPAP
jgi:hypothetical protein